MKYLVFDFVIDKDIPEAYQFNGNIRSSKQLSSKTKKEELNDQQVEALQKTEEQIILLRYSHSTLK